MNIPTEPIGSIPRPLRLIKAVTQGDSEDPNLDPLYEEAIRDTVERFEATGSPVITDGEQRKYHNFWTYCVHGLPNTAPDGFRIPFAAGHTRRMPRLTYGPFRYKRYADSYLDIVRRYAHVAVKQAVISPSALSLMYPAEGIPGYSREEFIADLLREHETEMRRCLDKGAHKVQIDFTEGRLAIKIDPSGKLLHSFIDLNNLALWLFPFQRRHLYQPGHSVRKNPRACIGHCNGSNSARREIVMDRDEDDLLKSVALQNAQSILAARLQAERELIQSKEALARRAGELAEEREWFRIVLSSIGDAVITTDVKGKITFLNPQAELLTGWSSSEALGQALEDVFNIVNEKTRATASNRIAEVLREGISAAPPRYTVLIARNGMEAAIEDSATPVRNATGMLLGAVLVFRDLAERGNAE